MLRAFCFLGLRKSTPLIQNSDLLADSPNYIKSLAAMRGFLLSKRKPTPRIQNSGLLADSPNHIKARSECYGLFAFWAEKNHSAQYSK